MAKKQRPSFQVLSNDAIPAPGLGLARTEKSIQRDLGPRAKPAPQKQTGKRDWAWFEALKNHNAKIPAPWHKLPAEIGPVAEALSSKAFHIYMVVFLASWAKGQNYCRLSKPDLAKKTGISKSQLFKYMTELDKMGLVVQKTGAGVKYPEMIVRLPRQSSAFERHTSENHTSENHTCENHTSENHTTHVRKSHVSHYISKEEEDLDEEDDGDDRALDLQMDSRFTSAPFEQITSGQVEQWSLKYGVSRTLAALYTLHIEHKKDPKTTPAAWVSTAIQAKRVPLPTEQDLLAIYGERIFELRSRKDNPPHIQAEYGALLAWISTPSASVAGLQKAFKKNCPSISSLGLLWLLLGNPSPA